MKKARLHPFIAVTIIFIAFAVGLVFGRSSKLYSLDTPVQNDPFSPSVSKSFTDDFSAFSNGKLNINAAGIDDLMLLPGIGETLAQRIVEYRSINGCFKSIDELTNVKGIGDLSFKRISNYIIAGGYDENIGS